MIIEGDLLEVGKLNGNGWGISENGARDILMSLPGVPLKICEDRAHACDYNPSTKAGEVIGKVLSAERVDNMIRIKGQVDESAAYRIRTGKYPRAWSIFAGYQHFDVNKFLTGAKALSVSLVNVPAYPAAGYMPNVGAGLENLTQLDTYYLRGEPAGAHICAGHAAAAKMTRAYQPEETQFSELDKYYLLSQEPRPRETPKEKALKTAERLHQAINRLERKKPAISLDQALNKLHTKYEEH